VLQALRLGHPLVEGSAGTLTEAALFLAIEGLAWRTRGGRQCWKAVVSSRWDKEVRGRTLLDRLPRVKACVDGS